jgi:hypothetical protein
MPATTDHPAFVQPPNAAVKIWRYMDFAKLVALLSTGALYFARVDQLDDPFEGSLSKAEFEHWKQVAADGEAKGTIPERWRGRYLDIVLANARRARRAIYVNCWHLSDSESEAMWRLYSPNGYGVAIESTYASLTAALPTTIHNGCFIGQVRYTDHHRESMPGGNIFYAVTHKRRAFEHEKETRAVIWLGDQGMDRDPDQATNPLGLSIPVDLHSFVQAIYISPAAPPWFADSVRAVVARFGDIAPVRQSELAATPYY